MTRQDETRNEEFEQVQRGHCLSEKLQAKKEKKEQGKEKRERERERERKKRRQGGGNFYLQITFATREDMATSVSM